VIGLARQVRRLWRQLIELLQDLVARFWASMLGGTGV
jgi:hypothetical protein